MYIYIREYIYLRKIDENERYDGEEVEATEYMGGWQTGRQQPIEPPKRATRGIMQESVWSVSFRIIHSQH